MTTATHTKANNRTPIFRPMATFTAIDRAVRDWNAYRRMDARMLRDIGMSVDARLRGFTE